MPEMEEDIANLIRVKLFKRSQDGLGFLIKPRTQKPYVVISDLVNGGMAEQSGLVEVGDVIIKVNDVDLSEMSYEKAVELFKAIPVDAPVVLLLRGPDGYATYLQTTFEENGAPKTIRVTKQIVYSDSIVNRIRKTFARSLSPSTQGGSPRTHPRQSRSDNSPGRFRHIIDRRQFDDCEDKPCCVCSLESNKNTECKKHNSDLQDAQSQTLSNMQSRSPDKQKNLEDECNESPKIVVTKPSSQNKSTENKNSVPVTSTANSGGKQIEIHQNTEELTVVVNKNGNVNGCPNANVQNGHPNGYLSDDNKKGKMDSTTLSPGKSKASDRRGSSSASKKYIKLRNVADDKFVMTDTLHNKIIDNVPCSSERCLGSLMDTPDKRPAGEPRSKADVIIQAKDFIEQYYTSIKRLNTPAYHKRIEEVVAAIEKTGTYELSTSELTFGAKTAWRNAPRCIGRIQWSKLQVFDARHITTARGMFEAICNHIKYGTNKGNLRSAITIFPPRTDCKHDYRVWNPQVIRYAGYKQPDGSVIGDPANVEFTEICLKMGWKGKGGMFDVLPLVLQANGFDPELFEIPQDLVLEVNIKHPKFPGITDLGLKWYALPAVSQMIFDCGGLEFTAAPFNGWYMGTEIGARDFCDKQRYNLIETIAEKMGLDTRKNSSLWRDRALVETNVAVLHSFQAQGVTITDHHAASDSFMKHLENEQKLRGGCPGDWVWVVPPMSGSILPVFHQEMLLYKLRPSYEYQEDPWKTHVWKKDRDKSSKSIDRPKRKFGFKELARAVKFSAKLMGKALARRVKCTILYATETGRSEGFAKTLCEIFKHAFDAKVMAMEEYDLIELEHEALVLIVTSTFGNGDPPENGEGFAKSLHDMRHPKGFKDAETLSMSYYRMSTASDSEPPPVEERVNDIESNLEMTDGPLSNVRYSVFALGSRAYPNFCAFGHFVDNMLNTLGSERINKIGEGDELCGQEESFKNWAQDVFKAACDTFCVGDDNSIMEATGALSKTDLSWSPGKFRLTPAHNEKEPQLTEALSKVHNRPVYSCKLTERIQLQSPDSNRQTILVKLNNQGTSELGYAPGDHVAIFPANNSNLVDRIIARLQNAPSADQLVKVEVLQERTTPMGTMKTWNQFEKIPLCTLRTAFSRFLDITTPPSQALLKLLAAQATRDTDREKLENLANDMHEYEDWKYERVPNLVEVLDEFPSLRVNPTLLITQLPLLQQRFYSISSSPQATPDEIHATIAIVNFKTMGGVGPVHEGVCSAWLNRCDIGELVPCVVRTAPMFHLPEDKTLPVVMVGPGTGIAPFRSFWQQRKVDMDMLPIPKHGEKTAWGEMHLYFGCRQSTMDDIYHDELKVSEKDGVITKVYKALSREPNVPKTYVQDIIKQNSAELYENIVRRGGHFYVCGDVQMASDVSATLSKIFQEVGKMKESEAQTFMLKLREANRFHEDIFGVTVKKEVTERVRDQAKKAWKYINTPSKSLPNREVVSPLPAAEKRSSRGKLRPPLRSRSRVYSNSLDNGLTDSADSLSSSPDK